MKQLNIQIQNDPDKLFSKIILDLLPEEYFEGYSDATTTTLGAEVEQEILEDIWNDFLPHLVHRTKKVVPKKRASEAIWDSPALKSLDNLWFLCHLCSDLRLTLRSWV